MTRTQSRFFQSGTQALDSFRSLGYARGNESIIYFADLCKPIEIYIYARKKAPICKLFRSKALKRRKLSVTDIRKDQWTFFCNKTARASTLALATIFQI